MQSQKLSYYGNCASQLIRKLTKNLIECFYLHRGWKSTEKYVRGRRYSWYVARPGTNIISWCSIFWNLLGDLRKFESTPWRTTTNTDVQLFRRCCRWKCMHQHYLRIFSFSLNLLVSIVLGGCLHNSAIWCRQNTQTNWIRWESFVCQGASKSIAKGEYSRASKENIPDEWFEGCIRRSCATVREGRTRLCDHDYDIWKWQIVFLSTKCGFLSRGKRLHWSTSLKNELFCLRELCYKTV